MNPPITVTPKKIREFGHVIMVVIGILLPLWIMWQDNWVWDPRLLVFTGVGLLFEGLCSWAGMRMAPLYLGWMRLAMVMGTIMTAIIVSFVFFLLITPIGLVRRLFKRPSDYNAKPEASLSSYWKDRNEHLLPEQLEKMY